MKEFTEATLTTEATTTTEAGTTAATTPMVYYLDRWGFMHSSREECIQANRGGE